MCGLLCCQAGRGRVVAVVLDNGALEMWDVDKASASKGAACHVELAKGEVETRGQGCKG